MQRNGADRSLRPALTELAGAEEPAWGACTTQG